MNENEISIGAQSENRKMAREDMKLTSLGWLPYDWQVELLENVCLLIQDGTHFSPTSKSGPYKYITSKNIRMGKLDLSHVGTISMEDHERIYKSCPVKEGDILLTKDGAGVGHAAINTIKEPFSLLSSVAVLRGNPSKVENAFMLQFLLSPHGQWAIQMSISGQAITRMTLTTIKAFIIPLPPLPEQRKIAAILNTWDTAIDTTEKLIAAKEQLKKGLMQRLLTGKLRFREFTKERHDRVKLGGVSRAFSGGTPSRKQKKYFGGNIPWIKSGELNSRVIMWTDEHITEEGLKHSSTKLVQPETILVAMYGATAGKIAITYIRAAINQAILAIIPLKSINNTFLFYQLERKLENVIRLVQGGQPNLNAQIIKEILIELPSTEEQQKIASVLSACDHEIQLLKTQLAALKHQKKGLMRQLLTGLVRVEVEDVSQ